MCGCYYFRLGNDIYNRPINLRLSAIWTPKLPETPQTSQPYGIVEYGTPIMPRSMNISGNRRKCIQSEYYSCNNIYKILVFVCTFSGSSQKREAIIQGISAMEYNRECILPSAFSIVELVTILSNAVLP